MIIWPSDYTDKKCYNESSAIGKTSNPVTQIRLSKVVQLFEFTPKVAHIAHSVQRSENYRDIKRSLAFGDDSLFSYYPIETSYC